MKTVKQQVEISFKSLDFSDKVVMLPIMEMLAESVKENKNIEITITVGNTWHLEPKYARKALKILSDLDCRTPVGENYEDIVKSDNSQEEWHKILLLHPGTNKLQIVKILKEKLNLGLKETKDLVDAHPIEIDLTKYNVEKSNYLNILYSLKISGATVQILKEPSI